MKIFNAVLLAGLFAAVAAQEIEVDPELPSEEAALRNYCPIKCEELELKLVKAVDSTFDDKDWWKFVGTLEVKADDSVTVEDLLDDDLKVKLLNEQYRCLDYARFDDYDDCTLRANGKSAVCKNDWARLTITEDKAKAHKDTTAKTAGGYMYTYTYFKITGVFKKVDFKKDLTDKLYVKIEVGNCYEKDKIECDLKNLAKSERAICKA